MSSKAHQIIDHFTDDAALKAKILDQIERVRSGKATMDSIIAEHTDHPGVKAKIKEIVAKVNAGHSIHHITHYHHSDPHKATRAAENVLKHHGVVEHILKS